MTDKTPEELERQRQAVRKYRSTPKYKKALIAWRERPEGMAHLKAYRQAYYQREDVKKRCREIQNKKYATDPEFRKRRAEYQRHHLRGMSPERQRELMALQNAGCAICKRTFSKKLPYHADHCHDSGKCRGLLCFQCNLAEGAIRATGMKADEFGQLLAEYLKKHE